jgi:hypothetical protein
MHIFILVLECKDSTPPSVLELAEGEWDRAGKAPCDAIKQFYDSTSTSASPEPEGCLLPAPPITPALDTRLWKCYQSIA